MFGFLFLFLGKIHPKKKKWFSHKTRNPLKVLSVTLDPFVVCFMCKPLIVLHITPLKFLSVTQNSHGSVLCEIFNSKFSHKTKLQGGTLGGGVKCDTMSGLHTKQYRRRAKCYA